MTDGNEHTVYIYLEAESYVLIKIKTKKKRFGVELLNSQRILLSGENKFDLPQNTARLTSCVT